MEAIMKFELVERIHAATQRGSRSILAGPLVGQPPVTCRLSTAADPRINPALRHLALIVLRVTGVTNIAAGIRYHPRDALRPLGDLCDQLTTLPESSVYAWAYKPGIS